MAELPARTAYTTARRGTPSHKCESQGMPALRRRSNLDVGLSLDGCISKSCRELRQEICPTMFGYRHRLACHWLHVSCLAILRSGRIAQNELNADVGRLWLRGTSSCASAPHPMNRHASRKADLGRMRTPWAIGHVPTKLVASFVETWKMAYVCIVSQSPRLLNPRTDKETEPPLGPKP